MKSLSKTTVILAKEALLRERTRLFEKEHYSVRSEATQKAIEEVNEAIRECLGVLYPVVTMEQVYIKTITHPEATVVSSWSPTFNDVWNEVKSNKSGNYQVNYNDNQKTSHEPEKEFYVTGVTDKFINLVPVEHWHNFNL